jgi:cellobiose dehydrogenase (acceptor)
MHSHITTNPTSYIVAIAEHAAAKILALVGSVKPSASATPTKASATASPPKSSTAPSPTAKPAEAVSYNRVTIVNELMG